MVAGGESTEALHRDLDKASDHDDGEDEDAKRLKPSPSDGVLVLVFPRNHPRRGPDDGRAEQIQSGVHEGRQDGQGAGEHGDYDLASEQKDIRCEVDVDCDLDDAVVALHAVVDHGGYLWLRHVIVILEFVEERRLLLGHSVDVPRRPPYLLCARFVRVPVRTSLARCFFSGRRVAVGD